MGSSSTSPSFCDTGVGGVSCGAPGTRDAKLTALFSADLPQVAFVMVLRDHTPIGPHAAFFKESMRRDAMIGRKIIFALRSVSSRQPSSHSHIPPVPKTGRD